MTHDEVVDLLSAINVHDHRAVGRPTIAEWLAVADVGRWTYVEALAAMRAHFTDSKEYLMPAHITERIRAARADAAARELAEAAAVIDVASAERVAEIVAELAETLAWPQSTPEARAALRVRCPHCRAAPGERCQTPSGKRLTESPCHPSRLAAVPKQEAAT
jgi:hypothetical protein